jgi:hypothetical protein
LKTRKKNSDARRRAGKQGCNPFVPNAETIEAMLEARRGELVSVGGIEELMADLKADDTD